MNVPESSGPSPFLAISRFRVANAMTPEVREAFLRRPHLVDGAAGFVRMEVVTPLDDPDEFWLLTYWMDQESFRSWHHSHTYRESHSGIPRGLRLDPVVTQLRFFEKLSD